MMKKKILFSLILIFLIFQNCNKSKNQELNSIIKSIQPSVVAIYTFDKNENPLSQGSGFFINDKGFIVTNRHVLSGASTAKIKTFSGKLFPIINIVSSLKNVDLLTISAMIPKEDIKILPISKILPKVGDKILVIGNPLGLDSTVSDGIVAAIREVDKFGKIVQITAPISPGSSGSPVVNMNGEVIGVATLSVRDGQNLNFAIPVEKINELKTFNIALKEWTKIYEWFGSLELFRQTNKLFDEGNYRGALQNYQKLLERNPNNFNALFNIGLCFKKLKQYEVALNAFKKALALKHDANVYGNIGDICLYLKRNEEALEAYKEVIRIDPKIDCYTNLGLSYARLGHTSAAIESYKKAISLDSENSTAYRNLVVSYTRLKDYDTAYHYYQILKNLSFTDSIEIADLFPKNYLNVEPDNNYRYNASPISRSNIFLSAEVEDAQIYINENIKLKITLANFPNPKAPKLPPSLRQYFQLVDVNTRTGLKTTKNKVVRSTTYVLFLRPKRKGVFMIPSIQYELEGEIYKTQSFRVEVR